MVKRICAMLLAAALLAAFLPHTAAVEVEIPAPSAVLMDAATGTVLIEKKTRTSVLPRRP